MHSQNKLIIVIVISLSAISLFYYFFLKNISSIGEPTAKQYKFFFPEIGKSIYVRSSLWGLTGDHMQILFSDRSINNQKQYDSTTDLIFFEPTVYIKQNKDTLIIYSASLSKIPVNLNSKVVIKQIQIIGYDEAKAYENNYASLGLQKITVYNK